jgi:hypothetical protein
MTRGLQILAIVIGGLAIVGTVVMAIARAMDAYRNRRKRTPDLYLSPDWHEHSDREHRRQTGGYRGPRTPDDSTTTSRRGPRGAA